MKTLRIYLLFYLELFCQSCCSPAEDTRSWAHTIVVTGVSSDSYNEPCVQRSTGTTHCTNLTMALEGLRYNSTLVLVNSGNYTLDSTVLVSHMKNIAVIGGGIDETIVTCNNSSGNSSTAGIVVSNSADVEITSISFNGCGQEHQLQLSTGGYKCLSFLYSIPAALYFSYCHTVLLQNVSIADTNGSGLMFNQVSGNVIVSNCLVKGCYGQLRNRILNQCNFNGFLYDYTLVDFQFFHGRPSNDYSVYDSNDCSITQPGGGIAIINPSLSQVNIQSCVLTNNTRGLFVLRNTWQDYDNASFNVNDTIISSNLESSLIMADISQTVVNFYNANITDHIKAVTPNSKVQNYTNRFDFILLDIKLLSIYFVWEHDYSPLAFEINNQQLNCYLPIPDPYHCHLQPDFLCSESISDYEGISWQCSSSYVCCEIINRAFTQQCCNTGNLVNFTKGNHNASEVWCGLTSHCNDGFSLPINSLFLSCTPESKCNASEGWVYLILLEFIPVTLMVATITILNVNLNQGSLKAFVFFCQIISIPFNLPSWFTGFCIAPNYDELLACDLNVPFPFSVWNLDFINFLPPECYYGLPICISSSTSPLLAILFWYVIALYPFVLLVLIFFCKFLYDRGYRCVVCAVRPVHRLLARFWRMFDIQPSLTHTVASVYTLCFTQTAAVSLKILQHKKSSESNEIVFFYDGSQKYFHNWHGLAVFFAVTVLLFFIIIPSVYLTIYPFQWFQKCFNKMKFKKDFLISVTDVFMGPFQNGKNNSWDYRYLAGIYFEFQLLLLTFYCIKYIHDSLVFVVVTMGVSGLFAAAIMVFKPYKRNIHTFTQVILLGVFMICIRFPDVIHLIYLQSLNFLAFIYCLYWMLRRSVYGFKYCRSLNAKKNTSKNDPISASYSVQEQLMVEEVEDDGEFADRIMNPGNYNNHHVPTAASPLVEGHKMGADYRSFK